MAKQHIPGALIEAYNAKKQKASGPIKMSGKFHGKSNALGHGGRAAQLKARGVPGGVIGNLAHAEGAAPGGPNFHGKKGKRRKGNTFGRYADSSGFPNMKTFGAVRSSVNPGLASGGVKFESGTAASGNFGSYNTQVKKRSSHKKRKVAMPAKGEMGMVMKRAKKDAKFFGTKDIKKKKKRKGAGHTASRTGFDPAGKDLHEEKRSTKKGKRCKSCNKTACKHMKRKTAKKA